MTNPFTSFAFNPTGVTLASPTRTMPLRLADFKNVKDFGATGAGFPTDDLAAIQAATVNFVASTSAPSLGTVYFPPWELLCVRTDQFRHGSPNGNVSIVFSHRTWRLDHHRELCRLHTHPHRPGHYGRQWQRYRQAEHRQHQRIGRRHSIWWDRWRRHSQLHHYCE